MKHQGQRIKWAVAMVLAASVCTTGCNEHSGTEEPVSSAQAQTSAEETSSENTADAVPEESVSGTSEGSAESTDTEPSTAEAEQLNAAESGSRASYDEDDMTGTYESFDAEITLSGDSAAVTGDAEGVIVSGSDITISKGGTYCLSGTLTDGQLCVTGTEKVKLYMDGVSITNADGAAIVCTNEKRTILSLAEDTENTFKDGGSYTISEDDGAAAIYAKDKLTINGAGTLIVTGTAGDGIVSKDDLKVTGGTVQVDAVHNGMKGTDSVSVCGGVLNITAGNDALKSTKADNTEKGWVAIDGGEINVTAGGDGIQAETTLEVTAGTVNVITNGEIDTSSSDEGWGGMMGGGFGGGMGGRYGMDSFWQEDAAATDPETDAESAAAEEETLSSKGLKAGGAMTITGGMINVTSTDHCVHADGVMELAGGSYALTSTLAKGIKSVGDLTISGEETAITIHQCTEGIESKSVMNINGGNIRILDASDDGLNTGGMENPDHTININGGSVYINTAADGTDSNGDTNFNGGIVIVSGPTTGANGSLDGDGTMILNGGTVLGLSSRGMMEYPAGCMMTSSLNVSAGDMISILDGEGNLILAVKANKNVSDVIFGDGSGDAMASYQLVTGGTYAGMLNEDGWAAEGTLEGGSSCTWSQMTSAGGGMFGGGGMMGGFGGRGGRDNMMQGDMGDMTPPGGFDGDMEGMTPPGGFGGFGGMFGEESSAV